MQPFTEKVINIIQNIPSGKVMTYGQIAKIAGNPRGARQVVRVLHTMSQKYGLPWHRVINAKGEIVISDEEQNNQQFQALREEGIEINAANKVNLSKYRYEFELDDVDLI